MASSTGLVVTAGVLSLTDLALDQWDPAKGIRISVATVLGALISSGLDRTIPGLGTGIAVVLLTGVVLTSGPRIAKQIK